MPHTPTPRTNSHVTATIRRFTSRNAHAKPMNNCGGVFRNGLKTTPPISSVTVP